MLTSCVRQSGPGRRHVKFVSPSHRSKQPFTADLAASTSYGFRIPDSAATVSPGRGGRTASWRTHCAAVDVAPLDNPDIVFNIARSFDKVQHPARHNTRYAAAIEEFRHWVVLAYECGYREDDILLKLTEACDTSASQLKPSLVMGCVESVCIIWMTLEMSARPVNRWATQAAVSSKTKQLWRGFVSLIVTAYFERRWAAYPIDRLQVELAVVGRLERPDIVAEWTRLVFETLNHVSPQFPSK